MEYLISVLIPIYNVEKYIEKCLTSLFNNKHAKDCEFIITNDYTPDNSITIVNNVINKYPELTENIKIINHEKNKGLAGARNTGLFNSHGKYILNVDSDDYVENNYLDEFYEKAKETDSDLIICDYFIEEENKTSIEKQNNILNGNEILNSIYLNKYKSYLWCKLFKREIFLNNNLNWIEGINLWEDMVICTQFLPFVKNISKIDKPLYHYLQRSNSYVHEPMSVKKASNMIDAIIFADDYLKKLYKDKFNDYYYESLIIRKINTKYYTILEGNITLQKKYYYLWPECLNEIDKSGFGKFTKITLKTLCKNKFLGKILLFINSIILIFKKKISFKYYFKRCN